MKRILTGLQPTGVITLGNYIGAIKQMKERQNEYESFIFVADLHAITIPQDPETLRNNRLSLVALYLACGIDPEKSTIYIQSMIPEIAELTVFYSNLVTIARLQRNPTVKTEIAQKRDLFGESVTYGFLGYPVSQAADITAFKANIIPVGDDQEPMLEQTREIVRSFNRTYNTNVLVECKAVLPENAVCYRLPGLDGSAKMSKSLNNCIYLSDDEATIKKKINSMSSFPRNIDEPGIIEGNVMFTYLNAFANDAHFSKYYPEFKNLDELTNAYQKGGIGDGRIKKFLNDVMQELLLPIRERRCEFEKNIPMLIEILNKGTKKAQDMANETLNEVKAAMGINYFEDDKFIQDQINKYNN